MKKLWLLLSLFLILFITPLVSADTGPKPFISLQFSDDTSNLYITLLGEDEYNGPWISFEKYSSDELSYAENLDNFYEATSHNTPFYIFIKFLNYQDDYYFYGLPYSVNENNEYRWYYYPPDDFKVLIYNIDTDSFSISQVYSCYAFSSYYEVSLSDGNIKLTNNYNYTKEILFLVLRIVITIAVELLVALIFIKWFKKREFLIILFTNIVTQIILNVLVNLVTYFTGLGVTILILGEIIVLILELITYLLTFKKGTKGFAVTYVFLANTLSFIVGILLL